MAELSARDLQKSLIPRNPNHESRITNFCAPLFRTPVRSDSISDVQPDNEHVFTDRPRPVCRALSVPQHAADPRTCSIGVTEDSHHRCQRRGGCGLVDDVPRAEVLQGAGSQSAAAIDVRVAWPTRVARCGDRCRRRQRLESFDGSIAAARGSSWSLGDGGFSVLSRCSQSDERAEGGASIDRWAAAWRRSLRECVNALVHLPATSAATQPPATRTRPLSTRVV